MPTQLPTGVSPQTAAVHAGEARYVTHHSLTVPIVQTATYTFADTAALIAYQEDKMFWDAPERVEYGRYGNPTVYAAQAKLAALREPPCGRRHVFTSHDAKRLEPRVTGWARGATGFPKRNGDSRCAPPGPLSLGFEERSPELRKAKLARGAACRWG